ncbi:MAG: hypothetical protein JSW54_02065 [Fidelibacterota bacterium]|nr:MAG: hypothetical protein JSW54_02065 [Candidatus Neomarinimicrobiota bacterium]
MWCLSHIPIFLLIALLFFACEPEDSDPGEFRYPLQVGNRWEYTRETGQYIYEDMDSAGTPVYIDTTTYPYLVTALVTEATTWGDTLRVSAIYSEEVSDSFGTLTGTQYYTNHDDGLYCYAYMGGSDIFPLPKRTTSRGIRFKDMSFSDVHAMSTCLQNIIPYAQMKGDSLYFNDPPRKVIQYPLEVGTHWLFSTRYIKIDKEVMGKESIQVPAGNFDCWKIQWLYDMNHDEQWDENITIIDYICHKGLIKRILHLEGAVMTTLWDPDGSMETKWVDIHDEAVLTYVSVD